MTIRRYNAFVSGAQDLSLRWDQVDLDNAVIHLSGELKTEASAQPVPLTSFACQVLRRWKAELPSTSPYVFPSPGNPLKPIGSVKRAWRTTLKKARVDWASASNFGGRRRDSLTLDPGGIYFGLT